MAGCSYVFRAELSAVCLNSPPFWSLFSFSNPLSVFPASCCFFCIFSCLTLILSPVALSSLLLTFLTSSVIFFQNRKPKLHFLIFVFENDLFVVSIPMWLKLPQYNLNVSPFISCANLMALSLENVPISSWKRLKCQPWKYVWTLWIVLVFLLVCHYILS